MVREGGGEGRCAEYRFLSRGFGLLECGAEVGEGDPRALRCVNERFLVRPRSGGHVVGSGLVVSVAVSACSGC